MSGNNVICRVSDRLFGKPNSCEKQRFFDDMQKRICPQYHKLDYMIIEWLCNINSNNYMLYVKLTQPNTEIVIPERVYNIDEEEFRTEGVFLCENCNSMNTRYNETQTRAADEPTTKSITCMDCANKWTVYD